ncbi:MAG: signal peptide peptidase SppA [Alphaproteobacteria bacterium]|nr:signal peptide peptidase SppA [Alphaproteobacteria bacterium]
MALELDAYIDRRRLKRRLAAWRLAAVAALLFLVFVLVDDMVGIDGLLPGGRSYVARLDVNGIITDNRDRLDRLNAVAKDDGAKALIVAIDSPGGTVVGGETLYRALRDVAARKPVVAVLGTVAASAGYMTAVAADHIVAQEGTLTGSIGVIFQTAEITGLLEKLGVEPLTVKSGALKAVPSPFERLTPGGRTATQTIVDDIQRMFLGLVLSRRGLSEAALAPYADGRIVTGRQAVDANLADTIGGEREARRWLAEVHQIPATLPVRDVQPRDDFMRLREMASALARKIVFPERLTLDGLIAVWHPDGRG